MEKATYKNLMNLRSQIFFLCVNAIEEFFLLAWGCYSGILISVGTLLRNFLMSVVMLFRNFNERGEATYLI